MISGERRLERGEDENFAVGADFENRAAAVADVEAAGFIEGEAGGDAHAFDPLHRAAVGRNAVDGAVVAAGNEKVAVAIDRQAGGVHQFGDEGLHRVVRSDFVERDGNFLAALAAEGDVDVAFGVDGGAGDGMQVVGDLHAERHRERSAFDAAHFHADRAACGASGTRAISIFSAAITRLPSAAPNCTCGRVWLRVPKPLPLIETSPPGKAAAGLTLSIRACRSISI